MSQVFPAAHTDWMQADSLSPIFEAGPEPDWVKHWRAYYGIDFSAASAAVEQQLGSLDVGGYRLAVQLYRQRRTERGTCIVLHGYYDHMGLYGHLYGWLLEQGFNVLTCDLPGHGLSSGARASIGSFAEYQHVLKALHELVTPLRLSLPVHVIGQSTGAAIALELALNDWPQGLGQLVLLAPLVRPRAWRQSHLLYQGLKPFVQHIPRGVHSIRETSSSLTFCNRTHCRRKYCPRPGLGHWPTGSRILNRLAVRRCHRLLCRAMLTVQLTGSITSGCWRKSLPAARTDSSGRAAPPGQ